MLFRLLRDVSAAVACLRHSTWEAHRCGGLGGWFGVQCLWASTCDAEQRTPSVAVLLAAQPAAATMTQCCRPTPPHAAARRRWGPAAARLQAAAPLHCSVPCVICPCGLRMASNLISVSEYWAGRPAGNQREQGRRHAGGAAPLWLAGDGPHRMLRAAARGAVLPQSIRPAAARVSSAPSATNPPFTAATAPTAHDGSQIPGRRQLEVCK